MADLNQMELQHLRHLIGAHETAYQKLNTYSSQAVDPQIKQLFSKPLPFRYKGAAVLCCPNAANDHPAPSRHVHVFSPTMPSGASPLCC